MKLLLILFTTLTFAEPPAMMGDKKVQGGENSQNLFPVARVPTRDKLTGKCLVDSKDNNIDTLCPQITVVLLNEKKKQVATAALVEGKFSFPISDKKPYFIAILPKKYVLLSSAGPYKRGDDLIVKISGGR